MRRNLGFIPNCILIMQRKPKLAKALAQMTAAVWNPESKVDRGLNPNQWITNETPQPNANIRRRAFTKMPINTDFSS